MKQPKVSIVIPAYNEEASIGALLETILKVDLKSVGFDREIIVVDDGSKDKTFAIASKFKEVTVYRKTNGGKGSATKFGMEKAVGDWILIQDADLEYDPNDYIPLLRATREAEAPITVYGSRTLGQLRKHGWSLFPGKHPSQSAGPWGAGVILSFWVLFLYGRVITDTLSGYKVYPAGMLRQFNIRTFGFETDHELTAKLIRSGVRVVEVPVNYRPRSLEEGKKIKPSDFLVALWTFLKFRFVRRAQF